MSNPVPFLYELGHLKHTPRSGWHRAHVPNPESVAEHSWRVAMIAIVIAHGEGADVGRAAVLGLVHDLPETRVGDVGQVARKYALTTDPTDIVRDQTAELPADLAAHFVAAVREHENAKTQDASLEAQCSRDADKLECLLQALEYQQAGNQAVHQWVEDMAAAVTTSTGRRLAVEACEVEPSIWWTKLSELAEQSSSDSS